MKVKLVLLILILSEAVSSSAQNYNFTKVWEKVYGGFNYDNISANSMVFDNDSNLILNGGSTSFINGNKGVPNCNAEFKQNYDYWFLKLDPNGDKILENALGGKKDDYPYAICGVNNNYFLLGGISESPVTCDKSSSHFGGGDIWIVKVDSSGQKIWDSRFGGGGAEYLNTITPTSDNGFLITADIWFSANTPGTVTDTGNGGYDIYVVKIDSNGLQQWDNLYGSTLMEQAASGLEVENGSYLLSGITNSYSTSNDLSSVGYSLPSPGYVDNDGWLLKIDSVGNKIWDKRYGCLSEDFVSASLLMGNGNYLIAGYIIGDCIGGYVTDSMARGVSDVCLYVIDKDSGNILFQKRFGGNKLDVINQITQLNDGGYLLSGQSESDAGFEKSEFCRGGLDHWIVRMDSSLNILWDKTIGTPANDQAASCLVVNDSTFILAASAGYNIGGDKTLPTFDSVSNPNYIYSDIWVTKWTVSAVTGINELAAPQFSIYPNPVNDVLYVSPKKQLHANTTIAIIDLQGRVIKEEKIVLNSNAVIPIDVGLLAQGVYLVKLNGQVQRFVKL